MAPHPTGDALTALRRILDANHNRAGEALRVVEDFARFVLNSAALAAQLKTLRHQLRTAYELVGGHADNLPARDTPADVGTTLTTPEESTRPDATAVVWANLRRLAQALRTLEEYAKVVGGPSAAAAFKTLRYATYGVETQLAPGLITGRRFASVRLYVLVTEALCHGPLEQVVEAVIAGGADCLQLREKSAPDRHVLGLARRLREQTAGRCLLIINDRPDIAALCDADGVHVGQTELPAYEARRIVGPGRLVGVSTHALDQARAAVADGADYIGVGPIFPSLTKPRDPQAPLPGLAYLAAIAAEIPRPHVAISGIGLHNLDAVLAAGGRAVAVCSAVISADDPRAATAALVAKLKATPVAPPSVMAS